MTTQADTKYGAALAADLRLLADMAEADPLIADELRYSALHGLNVPVSSAPDPRAAMAVFIRAGMSVGGSVEKSYNEDYGSAEITFPAGALSVHVYADREKVCTRRVTGTREVEVTKAGCPACHAPLSVSPETGAQFCDAGHFSPEAVTVVETVEDVEWDCLPLLDEASA
jgi:hypothetical protein